MFLDAPIKIFFVGKEQVSVIREKDMEKIC